MKSEITQQEKIEALLRAVYAVLGMIALLIVLLFFFVYLGYNMPVRVSVALLLTASFFTVLQYFLIKKKWLIDISYALLYSLLIWILIVAGLYHTGTVTGPIMWLGLFTVVFDAINYNLKKGILAAVFYLASLWTIVCLELFGILPAINLIPDFDPYQSRAFIVMVLIGYSLLYIIIPGAAGLLAETLRKERRRALDLAKEKEESYRMSVSVMEDLESARHEVESKLSELNDSRRATLHLLRDVEEERNKAQEREKEVAKLYEDLKVIDQMKTEFMSVMSHELRTPITPIKGYASMLLGEQIGKLTREQKSAVSVIQKEGEHLLTIIDSILEISRMERGQKMELEKEPISFRAILEDLAEVYKPQADTRDLKMEIKVPKDFPTVIADETKVRRVLTNIIGNALKFIPKGGSIRAIGSREDGTVKIQIIDNGIGIAKENLERIFEKFYQVDSSFTRAAGGVGLGLAIAREVIEAHGGKIWAESEGSGKGTTICFTLPIEG